VAGWEGTGADPVLIDEVAAHPATKLDGVEQPFPDLFNANLSDDWHIFICRLLATFAAFYQKNSGSKPQGVGFSLSLKNFSISLMMTSTANSRELEKETSRARKKMQGIRIAIFRTAAIENGKNRSA